MYKYIILMTFFLSFKLAWAQTHLADEGTYSLHGVITHELSTYSCNGLYWQSINFQKKIYNGQKDLSISHLSNPNLFNAQVNPGIDEWVKVTTFRGCDVLKQMSTRPKTPSVMIPFRDGKPSFCIDDNNEIQTIRYFITTGRQPSSSCSNSGSILRYSRYKFEYGYKKHPELGIIWDPQPIELNRE